MSQVATTKGGQAALKILMGEIPDQVTDKTSLAVVVELPDIKCHLKNFSFGTFMGMNKHYKKKANQDQYICETNLMDLNHLHFFAVIDGHGIYGREISLKV